MTKSQICNFEGAKPLDDKSYVVQSIISNRAQVCRSKLSDWPTLPPHPCVAPPSMQSMRTPGRALLNLYRSNAPNFLFKITSNRAQVCRSKLSELRGRFVSGMDMTHDVETTSRNKI